MIEKGLYMQAVSLAREWVVSWVIWQSREREWIENWRDNKLIREPKVESALGQASARLKGKEVDLPAWFFPLEEKYRLGELWGWLAKLRNNIDHCGMQRDVSPPHSLEEQVQEIPKRLAALRSAL